MQTFEDKLNKLVSQAETKIIRKIIAYNKRKGNKKYLDLPIQLRDEVQFNISNSYLVKVGLIHNELKFIDNNGNYYNAIEIESLIKIVDSL
jgi:hypothetical protein